MILQAAQDFVVEHIWLKTDRADLCQVPVTLVSQILCIFNLSRTSLQCGQKICQRLPAQRHLEIGEVRTAF